jgi:hypothetical protein
VFDLLVAVVRAEIGGFLGALALIIAFRMLTGGVNVADILSNPKTGALSANSLQLLMLTLTAAGTYLLEVAKAAPQHRLPEVPTGILLLVTASNVAYTGARSLPRLTCFLFKERNESS